MGDLRVTKELGHREGWPWAQPHTAAPLREGLSIVMFYSPHTPLLKCKKRKKNLNRVLFTLKTLSMICELSQPG